MSGDPERPSPDTPIKAGGRRLLLPVVALVVGLVVSWATYPTYWFLGLLVLLVSSAYLLLRRRWLVGVALALSPYVVEGLTSFVSGVHDYYTGTAVMRGAGLPGPEFGNLDPELRIHWSTSGCVLDGTEAFTHEPYNVAVKLLIWHFGTMRGMYAGPYPTKAEVRAQLERTTRVSREQLITGRSLKVDGHVVKLSANTIARVGESVTLRTNVEGAPEHLEAAVYQGKVLLLAHGEIVSLIDIATGKLFATYVDWPAS